MVACQLTTCSIPAKNCSLLDNFFKLLEKKCDAIFCFFSRTEHIPKRWLHGSCQAVIFVYHYMLLQIFVLTIHCTRGAVEDSFLSSLYPSMLSVFSSPPSCWFLSPPSSSPPPSPPCPPSFHCCSGPALSLVPRIQATHTHKQFWVTL